MLKMRAALIGFAAVLPPANAAAETVIVNCQVVEQGNPVIRRLKPDMLFRIGNGKWESWSDELEGWSDDYCELLFGVNNDDYPGSVRCSVTDVEFRARMNVYVSSMDVTRTASLTLNRQTGKLSGEGNKIGGRNSDFSGALSGTCKPGKEPARTPPAPPPKRMF